MKYLLALVVALSCASLASAQCGVRAQSDVSAAAAVQNAQIAALVNQLSAQQAAPTASAFAGTGVANPQVLQLQALLNAQQRAATASALSLPSVQPLCVDGNCGGSRVRASSRSVTRPVIQRPARTRSVARSFSRP